MPAIKFYNDDCRYRLAERRKVREWLVAAAAEEGFAITEISYVFCSAQRLLEMNRRFLGHDYYTDVITFDYSDRKAGYVSGDIFIDVETVADNAAEYGATRREEMLRVVVHGLLHLCGQGDKTPRTNAQMHRKEDKYLRKYRERAGAGAVSEETGAAETAGVVSGAEVDSGASDTAFPKDFDAAKKETKR